MVIWPIIDISVFPWLLPKVKGALFSLSDFCKRQVKIDLDRIL